MTIRGLILLLGSLPLLGCSEEPAPDGNRSPAAVEGDPVPAPVERIPAPADVDAVVKATLRGIGFLERFDNGAAAKAFGEALGRTNGFWPAVLGRGVALANLREDPEGAERDLRRAVDLEPDSARAWFQLGMLHARGLAVPRPADAEPCFRKVVELVPDDADGHLRLGMALMDLGRTDEAGSALDRALELNPYLGPALYQRGTMLRNAGRVEEAVEVLRRYQALEQSKKVDFHEDVYGYQGPLGEMPREWGAWLPEGKEQVADSGHVPSPPDLWSKNIPVAGPALLADLDGDGRVDLVDGEGKRWRPGTAEGFGPGQALPLTAIGSMTAADLDHDGTVDLVAAGTGVLLDAAGAAPRVVALDGDDADGHRFTVDLDGDGWLDIVGDHRVWLSDGGRAWVRVADALAPGTAIDLVADVDGDGLFDLVSSKAAQVHRNLREGRFAAPEPWSVPGGVDLLAVADLNGDGRPDEVVRDGSGFNVRLGSIPGAGWGMGFGGVHGGPAGSGRSVDVLVESVTACDLDTDGDLDLVIATNDRVRVWTNPLDDRANTITLRLKGIHSPNGRKHGLCNAPGIGTRVDVHVGRTHRRFRFGLEPVPVGRVRGPSDVVVLGLGDASQADLISLRWTEGLVQSETDVKAGRTTIEEIQRKASW